MRKATLPPSERGAKGAAAIAGSVVPRLGLAFVLIWFGAQELVDPGPWTGYLPTFMHFLPAVPLILAHGYLLFALGCLVAIGLHTRIAAGLGTLLVVTIAVTLLLSPGGTALAVRDIGLTTLGAAVTFASDYLWTFDAFAERLPHAVAIRRPSRAR